MRIGSGRGPSSAKGSSKKVVKAALKNAKKSKPLAEPKSAVRVKPAAKQKPNKPDAARANYKASDGGYRAYDKAVKQYDSMPEAGRFGSAAERQAMGIEAMSKAPVGRRTNIQGRKLNEAEARKATTPVASNRAVRSMGRGTKTVKINSAAKAIKDELIMSRAKWNSAAKKNYRAQVKREASAAKKKK
jgi:hypothetical protein